MEDWNETEIMKCQMQLLNQAWSIIKSSIINAANRSIPKMKIFNTPLQGETYEIEEERNILNASIKKANKKFKLAMPEISDDNLEDWYEDIKGWWKVLNKKRSNELEYYKRREIEDCIERQYKMIASNQVYEPIKGIQEKWFQNLMAKITEEE
ncbi:17927_t:CDS:2, partial [Gigaspora margarita]